MSCITPSGFDRRLVSGGRSAVEELAELGWELNANQYRVAHLAARYDEEFDWYRGGFKSAASALAERLQLQPSTAREWVRVGYMLRELPLIDAAFRANEISYAKARILTRWADPDNEAQLLALAETRAASRLTTAIARVLAADEDDDGRDGRHHEARSFTRYTDGDGMVIIRVALPPSTAKPILAAIEKLVNRIAKTPADDTSTAGSVVSAGASGRQTVVGTAGSTTRCDEDLSADASGQQTVAGVPHAATSRDGRLSGDVTGPTEPSLAVTLAELRRRWQPGSDDEWTIPTMAQQRADAFAAFFLRLDIELTTEVVLHVRGDGNTFNDGTPLTDNAVARQLDLSFIRLMIHDAEQRPVNASSRRRHPTVRQERVVLEAHNHECVDCAATDLLEFDHNPPYHQTRRTITDELEPRCPPCHRARHRTTTQITTLR